MHNLVKFLLLINLVLVILLTSTLRKHFRSGDHGHAASASLLPPMPPVPSTSPSKNSSKRLDWRLLSLPDLHDCVAALRRVGCPASTIQDIIIAEVNRRFAPREHALKVRYEDYELWDAPRTGTRSVLERQMQLRDLFNEKKALLTDLLGPDLALELPAQLVPRLQSSIEAALLGLPEEKRERVRSVQTEYAENVDRLRARTLNYLDAEGFAEFIKIREDRRRGLGQILSGDELLDWDLKTSNLGQTMRSAWQGGQVSEAEFRQLYQHFQQTFDATLANAPRDPSSFPASVAQWQQDLLNSDVVKDTLGQSRYEELLRSRDPIYQQVQRTATQAGLPVDAVGKVYQFQKAAQQEISNQLGNQNLSNEERQRILRDIQEKTANAMREALGDEAFQKLEQSGAVLPFGPRVNRRSTSP